MARAAKWGARINPAFRAALQQVVQRLVSNAHCPPGQADEHDDGELLHAARGRGRTGRGDQPRPTSEKQRSESPLGAAIRGTLGGPLLNRRASQASAGATVARPARGRGKNGDKAGRVARQKTHMRGDE